MYETGTHFHTMKVTPARRVSIAMSVMVFMGIALLSTMLVSTVAAAPKATNIPMDDRISGFGSECRILGGTSSTHYDFGEDGEVASAQTTCEGGDLNGRVCNDTATTTECSMPFIAPTEPARPQQRPDTVDPLEDPGETPPVVDDNAVPPGGVAEDPTGEEQARIVDPAEACEALGGTANVIDQGSRVPIEIQCTGGSLDDMICYGTICDYFRGSTRPEEDPNVPPSGEIVFVRVESMAELEDALLAEDPTGSDTVVIYNQSGPTVSDQATVFVVGCEDAGGTATVTSDITVGSGMRSIYVRCDGGLLGGFRCGYLPSGYTSCFYRRAVLPEDAQVTPGGGIEAPAEDARETPTVAPTSTAVSVTPTAPPSTPSPTAVPTIELVEATAVPTQTPPDPKNDNAVPPGDEAEDPTDNEPAPTEAPLR